MGVVLVVKLLKTARNPHAAHEMVEVCKKYVRSRRAVGPGWRDERDLCGSCRIGDSDDGQNAVAWAVKEGCHTQVAQNAVRHTGSAMSRPSALIDWCATRTENRPGAKARAGSEIQHIGQVWRDAGDHHSVDGDMDVWGNGVRGNGSGRRGGRELCSGTLNKNVDCAGDDVAQRVPGGVQAIRAFGQEQPAAEIGVG